MPDYEGQDYVSREDLAAAEYLMGGKTYKQVAAEFGTTISKVRVKVKQVLGSFHGAPNAND